MRAVVRDRYGSPDVLRLAKVPKPSPGEGEVLVRVRAASANAGDYGAFRFLASETTTEDLVVLTELLEAGKVAPVIDRRYPLSGVADALRYLETGRARGKVVIDVAA